jgi:hypothetical protein
MKHAITTFELDPVLVQRLRRLGIALRLRLALRGIGWTVGAACVVAWVSFALDYGLHRMTLQDLGPGGRILVSAACLCFILAVAWKRLIRSLLRKYTDDGLAMLVEKGNPELQDRLASAIHFARSPECTTGASPELVRKVLDEADRASLPLRFASVLLTRPVWVAVLTAAALSLGTATIAMVAHRLAVPWAERNILFRNAHYPRQTVLHIKGGNPIKVLRGDSLSVNVVAEPGCVAPREVTFHLRFPSIGATLERVAASPSDPRLYVKTFQVVSEPFTFRVTGNDDRTDEVRVELAEPPELKEMELEVRAPLYTELPPRKVRRGAGMLDVPEDGVIALSGLATKDLKDARMFLDDAPIPNFRIGPDAGKAPRRIEGEFQVKAQTPFRPGMVLRIELRDSEGFVNPKAASYNLMLRQDQPPVCQLEAAGLGGEITSNAVVPLVVTAKDDYGVVGLHLELSVQSAPQNIRQEALRAYLPPLPEPETLRTSFDLRLAASQNASNTPPLQVGETLRLQAVATDSHPISPFKSKSNILSFRIVTAEDLMSRAIDAQRGVREQITQVIEMQKEVRDRCQEAAGNAEKATTVGLAHRELAVSTETQEQIRDLLANAAGRMESILENLRNNRAISGDDEVRLRSRVSAPLEKVATEAAPAVAKRMAAAKTLSDTAALAVEIRLIVGDQDQQVIRVLEAIVNEMLKLETAEQVERGIRGLIRTTQDVRDMMKTGTGPKPRQNETPAPQR